MPKTIKNGTFDKLLNYENLEKAYFLARRNKTTKPEVIKFTLKYELYLEYLLDKLKNMNYEHGKYRVFYINYPKLRKVEASSFMDRVVHTFIVENFLKSYYLPRFIENSYACLPKRGMHNACLQVYKDMKHCTNSWNSFYILKMDIRKYFENIDKRILYKILQKNIKDKKLLYILYKIINSKNGNKGLPIGNYTSQMFANIYLNEVDQYIKRELKCKYYYRYMDDSIIFFKTKEEAIEKLEKIKNFLNKNLKLELNEKTQIFKSKQGVNFCGYMINPYRIKIRNRNKKSLKKTIKDIKNIIKTQKVELSEIQKQLSGYKGYLSIANSYNLINKEFRIKRKYI